jgi:hypothetical protein
VAEKTVVAPDDERFIEAVSNVISRLRRSHGPLYAALLIRLQDRPTDEWTLLVGSNKLTRRRIDGINAILGAMKAVIAREFASRIRSVGVLRADDPIYTYLSRAFTLKPGATLTLDSCNVFGLEIARAVVFALGKPQATGAGDRAARRRRERRQTA